MVAIAVAPGPDPAADSKEIAIGTFSAKEICNVDRTIVPEISVPSMSQTTVVNNILFRTMM